MMKRKLEPNNSKVKDEKAIKQEAPLKADLIIQLKELQENFNTLEAINSKNLETIRDLEAKVVALEKEKCDTLKQTSELVCRDCDYKSSKVCTWKMCMEGLMKGVMKIWILLKDFEFVIDVTMKQKTSMT